MATAEIPFQKSHYSMHEKIQLSHETVKQSPFFICEKKINPAIAGMTDQVRLPALHR